LREPLTRPGGRLHTYYQREIAAEEALLNEALYQALGRA
jgi:hypothetical protein